MLPSEIPWVLHVGNGTRGPFPLAVDGVPITYADVAHIRVTRYTSAFIPTAQINGTDYQLSATSALPDFGDPARPVATASMSFKLAQPVLAADEFVLIERVAPSSQDLTLTSGGGFSAGIAERTFDAIVRVIQQITNALNRTITINRLDTAGALELPRAEDRAETFFYWDADGNPAAIPVSPGFGDLLSTNNLSDIPDPSEARFNLGIDLSLYALKSANLSDLGSATTARTNLGVYSTSQVDALFTALVNGAAAAYDTLGEIATKISAILATTISAAGLATGGGDLSANRTITVTAANATEARAMASTSVALTPGNLADIGAGRIHAHSAVAQSLTGTLTETALVTSAIAAADIGVNGWVEVETVWSVTNNANAKTPRVRFGASGAGIGGTVFWAPSAITNVASVHHVAIIQNRNSASSQVGGLATANSTGYGTGAAAPPTATINTGNASEVVISAQLGNTGDTITLESYTIRIFKRA